MKGTDTLSGGSCFGDFSLSPFTDFGLALEIFLVWPEFAGVAGFLAAGRDEAVFVACALGDELLDVATPKCSASVEDKGFLIPGLDDVLLLIDGWLLLPFRSDLFVLTG